ncbi:GTPase IMAP family member 8-like [Arapaima gigas]
MELQQRLPPFAPSVSAPPPPIAASGETTSSGFQGGNEDSLVDAGASFLAPKPSCCSRCRRICTEMTASAADIRLVLLGRRGSGKSSCGNTILGSKVFRSFLSTTPVTTECGEHTAAIHGRRVTVIDTPDFFGDSLPDPESHIRKCISMVGREPSVFLLVLQLGHFTEGEKKIVTQVQQEFGSKVKNMIVVFSYGDDLEDVTIEEFMKNTHPDLKVLVEKCGNRYHVLNNRDTSSDRQVVDLVEKVELTLNRDQQ